MHNILANGLIWNETEQHGFYHVDNTQYPYDAAYFAKYVEYAHTPLGQALTAYRLSLLRQFSRTLEVLDFGVGCGDFVASARRHGVMACGYDINPIAQQWLETRGWYRNPLESIACITFWDSFEHIEDPAPILASIQHMAFLSLPIFRNAQHALTSKHFKPEEHYWYFTKDGLERYFHNHGFSLLFHDNVETALGREDILTFVFQRNANHA